jgi:GTP-binding protein
MFVDEVQIHVRAGRGGDGCVSFRREKHVPRGGPDGGDGGRGGSVVMVADPMLTTLIDFRYKHDYRAPNGLPGSGNGRTGRHGADIELHVPVGTQVRDAASGEVVADFTTAGQREVVARGGAGGRGNAAFVSSTHQTPRFAERGEPPEERDLFLELKLLADVALIGFPNVGKSTLISRLSAARPRIADYPFTTLVPNLGVVQVEPGRSFVVADIPGLIAGASEGAGLGHRFLRHVERTRLLAHVLDVSDLTGREPLDDFAVVNRELQRYSERLAALPQVAVLNKCDMPGAAELVPRVREALEAAGMEVYPTSGLTGEGVRELLFGLWQRLEELPPALPGASAGEPDRRYTAPPADSWEVTREEGVFVVRGRGLERLVAMTQLEREPGVRRLQRILEKAGVVRRLRELGATDGDTVRIGDVEFDFLE